MILNQNLAQSLTCFSRESEPTQNV